MFGRRKRRSHFLLHKSFFADVTFSLKEADPESSEKYSLAAKAMAGLGIAGIAAGAYAIFSNRDSSEGDIEELPGVVEGATQDTELQPDPSVIADLKKKDSATAEPGFKPLEEKPAEPSFWSRVKSLFTIEKKEAQVTSQIAKGANSKGVPSATLVSSLPGNFRGKFNFSGIPGASILSAKGTYTSIEASTIVKLKTSGGSTSASSVMPKQIEELIRDYAKKYGVDEEMAIKVAKMESGGNPNAISSTGALGVYQFTGRTATEYGITNRFDAAQNIEAGVKLLAKNSKSLNKSSMPATPVNLYLMHQLGPSGSRELIEAAGKNKKISQLSKGLQRAIRLNYGGNSVATAKQYIDKTQAALEIRNTTVKVETESPSTVASIPVLPKSIASLNAQKVSSIPTAKVAVAKIDLKALERKLVQPPQRKSVKTVSADPPAAYENPATMRPSPQHVLKTKNGVLIAL